MNLVALVWYYLKAKPINTFLNSLLLALGIAVVTLLLLLNRQLKNKISENSKGIDLVVGAKGSPLQLVLCSVFQIDFPTGNISLNEAEKLSRHRLVKRAIPMALGDSYQNYRIVGTTLKYPALYQAELSSGAWWQKDLEVTAGWAVAKKLNLKVGDTFTSAHGLTIAGSAHEENRYVITGVMKMTGTTVDNLLLTNIASIWKVHQGHEEMTFTPNGGRLSQLVPGAFEGDSTKEITSLLLLYRNPIAAIQLPRYINSMTPMQAASPAFEIARLFSILGVGFEVLMGFAYVLIGISALSIFIALYNSLRERQYDLAIMRAMGASREKLFLVVIMEGGALTLSGTAVGIALAHLVLFAFTKLVLESERTGIRAFLFYQEELVVLITGILLGVICSLLPAIRAYRINIHRILAGG